MSIYLENLHARLVEELKRVSPPVIAKETGIARATVYNWMEKGNVPMDKLALLEGAGADVNYILTGQRSGAAMPVPAPGTQPLARDEEILLDNYRNSPPDAQVVIKAASDAAARTARGAKRDKAA